MNFLFSSLFRPQQHNPTPLSLSLLSISNETLTKTSFLHSLPDFNPMLRSLPASVSFIIFLFIFIWLIFILFNKRIVFAKLQFLFFFFCFSIKSLTGFVLICCIIDGFCRFGILLLYFPLNGSPTPSSMMPPPTSPLH